MTIKWYLNEVVLNNICKVSDISKLNRTKQNGNIPSGIYRSKVSLIWCGKLKEICF